MADYADRLTSISEKKQKLLEEEAKLIEKRKKEIGTLAEKFGLLTVSDTTILGIFSEVKTALKDDSDKLKSWETQGAKLLKRKRNAKVTEESTG
jgi:hypothetical protein